MFSKVLLIKAQWLTSTTSAGNLTIYLIFIVLLLMKNSGIFLIGAG